MRKYIYVRIHKDLFEYLESEATALGMSPGKRLGRIVEAHMDGVEPETFVKNVKTNIFTLSRDWTKKDSASQMHIALEEETYQCIRNIATAEDMTIGAVITSVMLDYMDSRGHRFT